MKKEICKFQFVGCPRNNQLTHAHGHKYPNIADAEARENLKVKQVRMTQKFRNALFKLVNFRGADTVKIFLSQVCFTRRQYAHMCQLFNTAPIFGDRRVGKRIKN